MLNHKKTKVMYKHTLLSAIALFFVSVLSGQNYPIAETEQTAFYDNFDEITAPTAGNDFYGQDASYTGNATSFTDNGNGTISDNLTGLMWSQSPDLDHDGDIDYDDKLSFDEALAAADTFSLSGYSDWRLPTIKELYSLILFSGVDVSGYEGSTDDLIPFINTDYFDFGYGDESAGERIIDAQMVSSTLYVGTTMGGDETVFGVNFADGRIKGYGTGPLPGQTEAKQFYIYFVRGNTNYGINDFEDNGDQTVTDHATGLMWTKNDNAEALLWQDALAYAENADIAGYTDWRLPNAKELQSILDYTRSPQTTASAAIDPVFNCTAITDEGGNTNYPFYWSGTTHANWTDTPGNAAVYVCFGEALGWMEQPPGSGSYTLMDVHGAGAQRSDFKTGNPDDYPYGHGPQGDVVRIYNYVRLVRDAAPASSHDIQDSNFNIYPNPAADFITIVPKAGNGSVYNAILFDVSGKQILSRSDSESSILNISSLSSGIYFLQITQGDYNVIEKIIIE